MQQLIFGKKTLCTELPAFVMGIVNATPDSFYSSSRGGFDRAMELIRQGADILDIGGESTRPGFTEVPVEEEINRVVPLIEKIRKESDVAISVDTRKLEVMKAACSAGADCLNDVAALEYDPRLADFCAESDISVILMHNFFATESKNPKEYKNDSFCDNLQIVDTVCEYLKKRVEFAKSRGVKDEKIILDPGIGFGKTFEEDIGLIKHTDKLCSLNYPVLMALSRKRCIGTMTEENGVPKTAENRLVGTVAADMISVLKGARLVRVHDVQETVDSLKVMKYTV